MSGDRTRSLQALLAHDTGGRQPPGLAGKVVLGLALAWSLFQLWHASPLPYVLDFATFNSTQARAIHLGFGIALAYLAWPARRRGGGLGHAIPTVDWLLAGAAGFATTYGFWFYAELAERPGLPTTRDLVVAVIGLALLLEAARRTLGLPLVCIALLFLGYVFFGDAAVVPEALRWKGASLERAMSHQWLTTEGVFGIALGVSTSFVFLFVLFGALLEQAGAGGWFIRVAFALLGALRGGPAKAAVLASGMTGIISGSSIANVVTTGTFTIPLMRRTGFSAERAGAIEVASSVNGQLTPPVMGAAAFLMVEYVGISYVEVIRHAILPAIIAYIALLYMVHLEALKGGLQGLPRRQASRPLRALAAFGFTFAGTIILAAAVYWGIGWIRTLTGDAAIWIVLAGASLVYLALLRHAARFPRMIDDAPEALTSVPEAAPVVQSGLYFLLPVILLIWCLTVERLSPGLSAFWATCALIVILLTQRPLLAFFRGDGALMPAARQGAVELLRGLIAGARNMIGIAVATATAGIIVGTVTLTGIGQVMTEFVEIISGGQLMLMLVLTAFICLLLGMGLPTTANYIVVSSLMAPVVVTLAGEQGLTLPLIAVHLFVFYFGIMADVTPPVGLAAYAAAAVSGGEPIRTGVIAFRYSLRTVVLPFLFLYNTELLLIGIDSTGHLLLTVAAATIGMLAFAAGTQGWFLRRCRLWEAAALLLAAFTLFHPGFWLDRFVPPYRDLPMERLEQYAESAPPGATLRLVVERQDYDGDTKRVVQVSTLGDPGSLQARMRAAGYVFVQREGETYSAEPAFNGPFDNPRYRPGMTLIEIRDPVDQPRSEWFYLPALLLLAAVIAIQRRRPEDTATRVPSQRH